MARLPLPAQTLAFGLKIARLFDPSVNFTGFSHTICHSFSKLAKVTRVANFSITPLWKLVQSGNVQDVTGTPSVPDLPRSSEGLALLEGGALHPMWTPVLQHLPGHRPQVWLGN